MRVEHAPPNEKLYANPMLSIQATGNSNSIRAFWKPLRQAGATTRACLVEAAARSWNVPAAECRTQDGKVIHDRTGRTLDYAALVGRAASVTPPKDAPLKDNSAFRLIGRPLKRLDTPEKTNGQAKYGIDALPPGVKFATLTKSPVLGGTVARVDDRRAQGGSWRAPDRGAGRPRRRRRRSHVGGQARTRSARCHVERRTERRSVHGADLVTTAQREQARRRRRQGSRATSTTVFGKDAAAVVTAEYEMPLLAHACMEPMNCTVHVTPTSAEAWIGTQVLARVHAAVAKAANLPEGQVTVHNHLLGGGFGRRLEPDMAYDAARIAKQVAGSGEGRVDVGKKTSATTITVPCITTILSARLQGDRIVGWKHKISGSAVLARFLPPAFQKGVDPDGVDSAAGHSLRHSRTIAWSSTAKNRRASTRRSGAAWVRTTTCSRSSRSWTSWRARRGKDPIAFRRAHLDKTPRLRAALDLVKSKERMGNAAAGALRTWRVGRRLRSASFIATVVECEVDEAGEIKLRRVTTAVDTGLAVNPDTIVAQMQGGHIFGLTAALYGEITLKNGRVEQSNFHDYQMLRMNQVPPIEVHLIKNGEAPGGIGETGTTAAVPALQKCDLRRDGRGAATHADRSGQPRQGGSRTA